MDAGDDRSAFNLAMCYSNGDGVAKDTDESLKLLEIASSRGNGRARGVLQQIMLDRLTKEEAAASAALNSHGQ